MPQQHSETLSKQNRETGREWEEGGRKRKVRKERERGMWVTIAEKHSQKLTHKGSQCHGFPSELSSKEILV